MGMNTGIFILNDAFGEIERNPKSFVDDINRAMNDSRDRTLRVEGRQVGTLFHELHADYYGLYMVGGNMVSKIEGSIFNTSYEQRQDFGGELVNYHLHALKKAAEAAGYRLVKTKKKVEA